MALNRASVGAHRGRLRVGVDDVRHRLVVGLARLAEDVRGDDLALVLAHVGQQPHAGDVADGPQPFTGAQVRVDRDAVRAGRDADRLQAEPVHARAPAGGDEQAVAAQLAAVVERQDVVLAVAPRGGRVHAQEQLDAVARRTSPSASPSGAGSRASTCPAASARATSPPRRRTAWAISAPTGPPPSISRRRGTAFMPVTSRLVQTPSSSRRPGTGGMTGSEPVATTTCLAVCAHAVDLDHARPGELAAAAQQVDALARQPALLPGVGVVRDHEVPPGQRRLDVDLRAGRRLARALHRLAGAQQRLGRDARPVGALAADQLALDHGHPQAAVGQLTGAVLARRAAAHDDHVVVGAHVLAPGLAWPGRPACSCSMYCAYQSGSACPICSSCRPCAAAARRRAAARSAAESKVACIEVPLLCKDCRPAGSASPGPGPVTGPEWVVISWSSQPLPSGSLNEANEP